MQSSSTPASSPEMRVFIVGLPVDDPESSLAESKFRNAVEGLAKVYPRLNEARATVKVSSKLGERKRFEVRVLVDLPRHKFDCVEEDRSLAEAFNRVSDKMKRLRTKPDKKQTYRNYPARSEVAARTM